MTGKPAAASASRRLAAAPPYSYRADPAVPAFPDDKGLVVFDGVCVLCSGFAQFILKHDQAFAFRLDHRAIAARPGALPPLRPRPETFETNLVLIDGRAYAKLDTVAAVAERLGGPWRALVVLRLLPRVLGDWVYDRVARNRYALFGRTEHCMLPPPEWRDRFIGS